MKSTAKVIFYKSLNNKRWYWTLKSGNNKTVAVTSETDGFPTQSKALRSFESVKKNFGSTDIKHEIKD